MLTTAGVSILLLYGQFGILTASYSGRAAAALTASAAAVLYVKFLTYFKYSTS